MTNDMNCCGIVEYTGLNDEDIGDTAACFDHLIAEVAGNYYSSSPAHVIMSEARTPDDDGETDYSLADEDGNPIWRPNVPDGHGKELVAFIKANKFGSCKVTAWRLNLNSGNLVRTIVWTPRWNVVAFLPKYIHEKQRGYDRRSNW